MSTDRVKMKLHLSKQTIGEQLSYRSLSKNDIELLGKLMLDAYRGTVDVEGDETLDAITEIRDTFTGAYGPVLKSCSFVIEKNGQALSAIIITNWDGTPQPLLTFTMTHPTAKNQGMSSFLIKKSVNALLEQGYTDLYLFVTANNLPARHVYEKLGFEVIEE